MLKYFDRLKNSQKEGISASKLLYRIVENLVPHHMAHGAKTTTLLGISLPVKSKTPFVLFVKVAIQGG